MGDDGAHERILVRDQSDSDRKEKVGVQAQTLYVKARAKIPDLMDHEVTIALLDDCGNPIAPYYLVSRNIVLYDTSKPIQKPDPETFLTSPVDPTGPEWCDVIVKTGYVRTLHETQVCFSFFDTHKSYQDPEKAWYRSYIGHVVNREGIWVHPTRYYPLHTQRV